MREYPTEALEKSSEESQEEIAKKPMDEFLKIILVDFKTKPSRVIFEGITGAVLEGIRRRFPQEILGQTQRGILSRIFKRFSFLWKNF